MPDESSKKDLQAATGSNTEVEVAELRAKLDALLNDPLDAWVENMHFGGSAAEFENTVSWKVTRPLRAVRTFQMRVGQLGFTGAVGHTARYVGRRLGRK